MWSDCQNTSKFIFFPRVGPSNHIQVLYTLLNFAVYTLFTSLNVCNLHLTTSVEVCSSPHICLSRFPVYISHTAVKLFRLLRVRSNSFWVILILVPLVSDCLLVLHETLNLGLLSHDGEGTTFLLNTANSLPVSTT
jgi:hypothetical protein